MSECEKDKQIYFGDEYEWEYNSCFSRGGQLTVTKKKPKGELKWRDITPHGYYEERICVDKNWKEWVNNYRLVQFYLEWEGKHDTIISESIQWYRHKIFSWSSHVSMSNVLYLSSNENEWSAPVVIPIGFYNKLDCYVSEFNQKLNKCEIGS